MIKQMRITIMQPQTIDIYIYTVEILLIRFLYFTSFLLKPFEYRFWDFLMELYNHGVSEITGEVNFSWFIVLYSEIRKPDSYSLFDLCWIIEICPPDIRIT